LVLLGKNVFSGNSSNVGFTDESSNIGSRNYREFMEVIRIPPPKKDLRDGRKVGTFRVLNAYAFEIFRALERVADSQVVVCPASV
jgi:hypothetical protein